MPNAEGADLLVRQSPAITKDCDQWRAWCLVFGREQCTAVGYNNCDSTEPVLPFKIPCSVAEEHEYIAHGMWIMAEISSLRYRSFY